MKSVRKFFLSGLCMGIADLIPGISGGTVALILGIYSPFLESLASFQLALASFWKTRELRSFSLIQWKVFLPVIFGMAVSIFSLAHLIHILLQSALWKPVLYSLFLGLVLASAWLCAKKIKWSLKECYFFFFAMSAAYLFSMEQAAPIRQVAYDSQLFNGWVIFCGVVAVVAMLLPGISGSYMLQVLGVYPAVIHAVVSLSSWDLERLGPSFQILINLSLGIVIGALVFSRLITECLKRFPKETFALLVGLMLGTIPIIWPFQISLSSFELGSLFNFYSLFALCAFTLGSTLVIFLEKFQTRFESLQR